MFNVGGGEILVILLLALIVLGPDKLPETARKAGRYLHEFRRMTSGFQEEFRQAMDLGVSDASEESSSSPDDAVHRTSAGPRLLAAPEIPTAPTEPPAAADTDAGGSPATQPEAPDVGADAGTLPADAPPAPGGGPELITPRRPAAPPEDDAGTSSAA
jgi:sec-independent protein translocase protein TatB